MPIVRRPPVQRWGLPIRQSRHCPQKVGRTTTREPSVTPSYILPPAGDGAAELVAEDRPVGKEAAFDE